MGLRTEQASKKATPQALRIFAATLNAGNMVYTKNQKGFDQLFDDMIHGHDEPGSEADIFMIGYQESHDDGYRSGERLRKKLWTKQTKAMIKKIDDVSEKFRPRPKAVREQVKHLKKHLL